MMTLVAAAALALALGAAADEANRAAPGYARLGPGDNVLVVGSRTSPYQFRVTVSPAPPS
jgi:hypothetical protein